MNLFFLGIFLIGSLIINGLLVWYSKILSNRLLEVYKNVDRFQEYLVGYQKNAESIFDLTDYYGDQTIKGLIEDTKSVVEACQNFKSSILDQADEEQNETKTTE